MIQYGLRFNPNNKNNNMTEEDRLDLCDLDLEILQRVEEHIKYTQESSDSYSFCDQELLEYSLKGVKVLR